MDVLAVDLAISESPFNERFSNSEIWHKSGYDKDRYLP
jgi:hypothetical protein